MPLPPTDKSTGLFKIWGSADDDVTAVGDRGLALHFDGAAWTVQPTDDLADLISVWGRGPGEHLAVGGRANGRVARWDGAAWAGETLAVPAVSVCRRDRATRTLTRALSTLDLRYNRRAHHRCVEHWLMNIRPTSATLALSATFGLDHQVVCGDEDTHGYYYGSYDFIPIFPPDGIADINAIDGKAGHLSLTLHTPDGDEIVTVNFTATLAVDPNDPSFTFCGG